MTSEHNQRLTALRSALAARELDGFLIPRADEFLGEYVPPRSARLEFISGFTGSAGLALVLADRAVIWSDGRYTLQLAAETDPALWERLHITEQKPEDWLKQHAAGLKVGYDPKLFSAAAIARFAPGLVAVESNPVDEIWGDRPAAPLAPATVYLSAGEDSADKRARIAQILRDAGQDAAILSDPASLAWLFNIRGADVEFCPIALGFGLHFADGTSTLFMAPEKITPALRTHLGNAVAVAAPESLPAALDALAGRVVRYDPAGTSVWFKSRLDAAGATVVEGTDPVALPRATKNAAEQAGSRAAHLRDGAAVTRFLHWFATARTDATEISAAERLLAERAEEEKFAGESFPAISGAGEHGAIIHYRASAKTDRPIKPNEAYLIDSGGQYAGDGTTDITRTLWTGPDAPPPELRDNFTRVLAGHIALARAVFPAGVAGPHLDVLARSALWEAGLDYDHGTGHGVGSYLSVHEGPAGISRAAKPVALEPGMILSNEPGFYLNGAYGIRLENLVLVVEAGLMGPKRFLKFETLTFAPFERALINPALLTAPALAWLNAYHAAVYEKLAPLLPGTVQDWLAGATHEI